MCEKFILLMTILIKGWAERDRGSVLLLGRSFINDVLELYDTFGNRDIEIGTKVCCGINVT